MAKKKPPTEDVLAALDALAPKRRTWFDNLDADAKAALLEIKRLRQTGECKHSCRTIAAYAKTIGARVAPEKLREWLDAKED